MGCPLLQVLAVDAACRAVSRSARPAKGALEVLGRKPGSSGNDGFVLVSCCCCGLLLRAAGVGMAVGWLPGSRRHGRQQQGRRMLFS